LALSTQQSPLVAHRSSQKQLPVALFRPQDPLHDPPHSLMKSLQQSPLSAQ
jgi:hypothetical protein